jgi:3-methyladenine DNA glycosylase/8-oxoguanine DNA glycosylase
MARRPQQSTKIPAKVIHGANQLAALDPVLEQMLAAHGPPDLRRGRPRREHFAELARMICYQQLAGRAAAAIHARFEGLFDGTGPTPEGVLALSDESLRSPGLSRSKAASIRDLAQKVVDGSVELDRVSKLPDAEVVRELTLVRGIGEWTAHMFLMFQLGRLDVWPTLDYGVRSGYARMFALADAPTAKQLEPLGDRFRPYRSLVAWYCWRAVDTVVPD